MSEQWPTDWLAYSRFTAVVLDWWEWSAVSAEARRALLDYVMAGGGLLIVGQEWPREVMDEFGVAAPWDTTDGSGMPSATSMWTAQLGLGSVTLVRPSSGFQSGQWEGLLDRWAKSAGPREIDKSNSDGEYTLSMIRGRTLPARSLLGILVLFVLVIGPLNLLIVAKLRRRVLLFVTTPLIGLLFSGAVFAYGLMHDGLDPVLRSRGVTLLDQVSGRAVTAAHIGYLAPFAPRDGLRFDLRTYVAPPSMDSSYRSAPAAMTLDLPGEQHFDSGLIEPRVPTHLRTVRVGPQRERVELRRSAEGGLEALNGLGARIALLRVATADGTVHEAEGVAPGAWAALTWVGASRQAEHEAVAWEEIADDWSPMEPVSLHAQYERRQAGLKVPRGGYVALVEGAPFVDPGMENLRRYDSGSLVIGRFGKEP